MRKRKEEKRDEEEEEGEEKEERKRSVTRRSYSILSFLAIDIDVKDSNVALLASIYFL